MNNCFERIKENYIIEYGKEVKITEINNENEKNGQYLIVVLPYQTMFYQGIGENHYTINDAYFNYESDIDLFKHYCQRNGVSLLVYNDNQNFRASFCGIEIEVWNGYSECGRVLKNGWGAKINTETSLYLFSENWTEQGYMNVLELFKFIDAIRQAALNKGLVNDPTRQFYYLRKYADENTGKFENTIIDYKQVFFFGDEKYLYEGNKERLDFFKKTFPQRKILTVSQNNEYMLQVVTERTSSFDTVFNINGDKENGFRITKTSELLKGI